MLKLINLVKKFGTFTAVDDIKLQIHPGDFFGFIGQNGAGKTTTIKMITGLYSPTSGSVLINGSDITTDPVKAKSQLGYIPDQPYIYEKLTGREFLFFSGGLYSIEKNDLKERISRTVDSLQIGAWFDKRTEEYSQGMKQRIIIASALLHNPGFLIVDEPMIGLDPQSSLAVKNILSEKAASGTAIFMSTHSLHVAEEICTRFGIIKDGALIFEGSRDELEVLKGSDHKNLESLFLELTR